MKKQLCAASAALAAVCAFADEAVEPAVELEETASNATAIAELTIANGQVWSAGAVNAEGLVLQPFLAVDFNAFGSLPVEFWAWGNYSTDRYGDEQTQKHCFTEIDLGVTTFFDLTIDETKLLDFSLGLTTWQYPNRPWNGEELIALTISHAFCDNFGIGVDNEYMISGDCKGDWHAMPWAKIKDSWEIDGFGEVGASLKGYVYYSCPDHGDDSLCTWSVKAAIDLPLGFSVFGQYWGQIDDDVYTDESHDDLCFVFGATYSVALD